VSQLIGLRTNLPLDEVVDAFIGEDGVHATGCAAADVRSEHDRVVGLAAKLLGVKASRRKNLDVATAAVNNLLVLH